MQIITMKAIRIQHFIAVVLKWLQLPSYSCTNKSQKDLSSALPKKTDRHLKILAST